MNQRAAAAGERRMTGAYSYATCGAADTPGDSLFGKGQQKVKRSKAQLGTMATRPGAESLWPGTAGVILARSYGRRPASRARGQQLGV
jgi:hypothetical protein